MRKYVKVSFFILMFLSVFFSGKAMAATSLPPLLCIDAPAPNKIISSSTYISGWALNASGTKQVNIYVDGALKGSAATGISRPDVAKAYPAYPYGSTSGYSYYLDISTIPGGAHTIKVQAVGNDGSTKEGSVTVSVAKLAPLLCIDAPAPNKTISSSTYVSGWALNASGTKQVNIYVDGALKGTAATGISRPDVAAAYPAYPNGSTSGYSWKLDVSTLPAGAHTIKVQAVGNDGSTKESSVTVSVAKLSPILCIDAPAPNKTISSSTYISGWTLNASGTKQVNIYVDGILKGTATTGISRPDVAAAYPAYPNGSTSGYSWKLDINTIPGGAHTIKVQAVGNDGSTKENSVTVSVAKLSPLLCIDAPAPNKTISGSTYVSGWTLNASGTKQVNVYVDGTLKGTATTGISRPDVAAAYPAYPYGSTSGYSFKLDISTLSAGAHTIKVQAVGNDGSTREGSVAISVIKLQPLLCIDTPAQNQKMDSSFAISGWALNASGVSKVEVYFDGALSGTANLGINRQDVANAYPAYTEGSTSGFSYNFTSDLGSISGGTHKLLIKAIGKDGAVASQSVNVYKAGADICIDAPAPNKTLNENTEIRGWAVNASGMKQVNIFVDGSLKGKASLGISRQDVGNVFPNYTGSSTSGYSYILDVSGIQAGSHSITVQGVGMDGSTKEETVVVNVEYLPSIMNIETPLQKQPVNGSMYVSGWALNLSGIKKVEVYFDGVLKGEASTNISRPDVANAYPSYPYAGTSGFDFNMTLDTSAMSTGSHKVSVKATGNNGAVTVNDVYVSNSTAPTIAIDMGHNVAYDTGASGIVQEDILTKEVGTKVIQKLTAMGYNVVNCTPTTASSTLDALQQRVDVANSVGADFFASIHFNAYDGIAHGSEVYYYEGNTFAAQVGQEILNNLSEIGFTSRGLKTANFFVLRNTDCPSILIECCFCDSAVDMKLYDADRLADAIVQGIVAKM